MEQDRELEMPEKNNKKTPHLHGQINLWERGQEYPMGESLFNKSLCKNWKAPYKRKTQDHFLTLYTKINSKWIKDLNVRPETIKIQQENNRQ